MEEICCRRLIRSETATADTFHALPALPFAACILAEHLGITALV